MKKASTAVAKRRHAPRLVVHCLPIVDVNGRFHSLTGSIDIGAAMGGRPSLRGKS
jgi:hypothetical protein